MKRQAKVVSAVEAAASDAKIVAAMPRIAREIAGAIGFGPTLALLRERRGERFYVPRSLSSKAGQRLVELLGASAATALVAAFAGKQFDVPMIASVERLLRNNAIRADFDSGASISVLVRRYLITARHLLRIVARQEISRPRG